VHDLYRARPKSADHRWHRNLVFGCELCFPKPAPPIIANPEPPVVHIELVQEQVLETLPQPEVEEVKPEVVAEIEEESELTSITSLAAAFKRIRK
jgi:hypothetical protein